MERNNIFDYFLNIFLFLQFLNNFLALFLCKINVLNNFDIIDFFFKFLSCLKFKICNIQHFQDKKKSIFSI